VERRVVTFPAEFGEKKTPLRKKIDEAGDVSAQSAVNFD
jgi:hypothetical protein